MPLDLPIERPAGGQRKPFLEVVEDASDPTHQLFSVL